MTPLLIEGFFFETNQIFQMLSKSNSEINESCKHRSQQFHFFVELWHNIYDQTI